MINMNGLSDDFTEVIARMLLRKEMILKGDTNPVPITDHWKDLYVNGYLSGSNGLSWATDSIRYNIFRAEVDAIVCLLVNHTYKRIDEPLDY